MTLWEELYCYSMRKEVDDLSLINSFQNWQIISVSYQNNINHGHSTWVWLRGIHAEFHKLFTTNNQPFDMWQYSIYNRYDINANEINFMNNEYEF